MPTPPPSAPGAARPGTPPHQAVTAPVVRGYERYAAQAAQWTRGYESRGGHVYCGAGCFACCDMPIRVSLAEAIITAQAITPEQARRVEEHARAVQANARTAPDEDAYVARHREDVSFCPLLDRATGSCSQYAARPTRCRDTFSAFSAHYCAVGTWESMGRRERAEYRREVARTPGTDGEVHFIAPLEHLSEPIWTAASRAMRSQWGLEVWGDFWTLTTLAADPAFMARVVAGDRRGAAGRARQLGLGHPITLEME
ncbi:YkgJ family cysteine cluster protein [uncultured Deinococcus sp.]|uniref:YkgJ family cysteine cluster protein n=1 Tax=uncultured Deinococcus sp. TaxID=158789 RepID=UPI00258ED27E|nr:YkgJ family cysteine cluster protein [uncultured Deinococcus sp.]